MPKPKERLVIESRLANVFEKKLGRHRSGGYHIVGLAYKDGGKIEIDPRLRRHTYLRILIHECFHMLFPEMSETEVERTSRLLTEVLWKAGYKKD